MFPTTAWTTIRSAATENPDSLQAFAESYRPPILRFIASRGFSAEEAEDICQDVFMRILGRDVLAHADRDRGRFRSLVLTIATRVIQDRLRRRIPASETLEDMAAPTVDPDFDQEWVLHLAARALTRLRDDGSPYFEVLRDHLSGIPQVRNRLWIARNKLRELIRDEVALTCSTASELEEELAYLSGFLRSSAKR